ncbi:TRAP transporter large permease subunit [Burkholderia anthina]|uniref:TRAP transporter large permease subunit n=1 Tax=Burkholderia anthina TaxID=179879 RepID=A0A6P2GDB2_9BURK|nr:TRAP transporter large permease subunit [Burkholderia anthina]MBM2771310.1 TRAP transporter large permease subunit [Burkholderia anthina]VVU51605.1 TrapT dctQ-M fusion permease, dicarboxylate transport [Burkholderia anthina]
MSIHTVEVDSQAIDRPARTPEPGTLARVLYLTDKVLGAATEIPAALLVVAEIGVLFSGVLSRYAMHTPLIWVDELASLLFIWLIMLGSAVAFRRGGHMRMTALVDRAAPHWRGVFELVATVAALTWLALVAHPAYEFASEEALVTLPALDISNAWRAAALPVGIGIILLMSVVRVLMTSSLRTALVAVVACVCVAGALVALQPLLQALGNANLLVFFVAIVGLLVFSGVPIAFAFGLATFGYLSLTTSTPTTVVIGRMDEGMSHLILLAVPLFVFLGVLIEMTSMAKAMVQFLANLLGHVRGGLSYVLIGSMYLVSGISGSKAADMAAIAPALFPEMKKRGAEDGNMVALLAATGAQTETVPPSLVLITIGSVTGISISDLFTGGLLPGIVLAAMLGAAVWWRSRKSDCPTTAKASWSAVGKSFVVALPALALPFVIRAAVVEGVATATEVSTIGIVYAIVVGLLVYRKLDVRKLWPALVDTAALSGAILLIIGTATGMAWSLTQSGFSGDLADAMARLPGGAAAFLAVSIIAFMLLGSVLEGIPAIVLFGPLLFPIARQLGIHDVHYSMVVVLAMGIGLFAPPFGVGYYAACAISCTQPSEGVRHIWRYMISLFIGTALVAAVPWISIGFLNH